MATEIRVWGEGREGLWSFGESVDIPDGYEEVPTGDPFVTRRIKALADTVYVRMCKLYKKQPSTPVALLAPREVVEAVRAEAERTAEKRAARREQGAASRERKEDRNRDEALAELRKMLPDIPEPDARQVVERAFEVGSGRVGRSGAKTLEEKLELAVRAHIRHNYSPYDDLLMFGLSREDARRRVNHRVRCIYDLWRHSRRIGAPPEPREPAELAEDDPRLAALLEELEKEPERNL